MLAAIKEGPKDGSTLCTADRHQDRLDRRKAVSELMMDHNVGVSIPKDYVVKKIDLESSRLSRLSEQ